MLLTPEQESIRDTARAFAAERLKPFAAEWDREARFPREALAQMGKLGFMGMMVPEAFGGAATDHVTYALALEEIAAGDASCSTIMSVHNSVGCLPILKFGSTEQKERFLRALAKGELLIAFCLTEPDAGSDASAIRTRAEKRQSVRAQRHQAVRDLGLACRPRAGVCRDRPQGRQERDQRLSGADKESRFSRGET